MNISFDYYKIFYTVAKTGNITKAASELMISQPAISKCIKHLEEQMGGQLFVRTKRGVVLTEEGNEFYKYIERAMEFISNAEHKFSEMIHLDSGTIRIGISTTLVKKFLLPYLEVFHAKYPKIHIQIRTAVAAQLFSLLRQGLIDLVVINLPYEEMNDIEIKKVKEVQDCFIVGEAYKALSTKKVLLNELVNYPLILQSEGSITRTFLDDYGKENGVIFKPEMDLSSFSLVVEFIKIGFGVGYTTEDYILDEIKNKKVYKLNVYPEIPKRSIGLAYSKRNIPSFCTKKFIEIILKDNV